MRSSVSGINAVVLVNHWHIPTTHARGGGECRRHTVASYRCVFLVGFKHQRLMAVHLRSECSGHILRAVHKLTTLIIQTQDTGISLASLPSPTC